MYRVNWIRARSRADRWQEEVKLLNAEMIWYQNYMLYQRKTARGWARLGLGDGYTAHAHRLADKWRRYGLQASSLWTTGGASTDKGPQTAANPTVKKEDVGDGTVFPMSAGALLGGKVETDGMVKEEEPEPNGGIGQVKVEDVDTKGDMAFLETEGNAALMREGVDGKGEMDVKGEILTEREGTLAGADLEVDPDEPIE